MDINPDSSQSKEEWAAASSERAETVSLPPTPECYELEAPPTYSKTVPDGHVRQLKSFQNSKFSLFLH